MHPGETHDVLGFFPSGVPALLLDALAHHEDRVR